MGEAGLPLRLPFSLRGGFFERLIGIPEKGFSIAFVLNW